MDPGSFPEDSSTLSTEFYAALKTPSGAWALQKLAAQAGFPLYLPKVSPLPHYYEDLLVFSRSSGRLTELCCCYVGPSFHQYHQQVEIQVGIKKNQPLRNDYPLALMRRLVHNLPNQFRPPFDWAKLQPFMINPDDPDVILELITQFPLRTTWELSLASGLKLRFFHQDRPGPLSLAYHNDESSYVAIGAVGVSRPDFEKILGSLIIVQSTSDAAIDAAQRSLNEAMVTFLKMR